MAPQIFPFFFADKQAENATEDHAQTVMRCGPLSPPRPDARALLFPRSASLPLLLLLLSACCAHAKDYKYTLEDLDFTCTKARTPPNLRFCNMVDWTAATASPKADFSIFTQPTLVTDEEQEAAAEEYYKRYATDNTRRQCLNGLKRLFCSKAFPECPYQGQRQGYFPPCEMFCRQVSEQCSMPIGCTRFPDHNCMVVIPDGFMVLQEDHGPYENLPLLYGVMLTLWSAGCLLWLFVAVYSNQEYTLQLCKFLSVVPCVKIVVLIMGFAFWRTCVQWRMCSYWLGVCLVNSHMIYETIAMAAFLLISKGWTITNASLDGGEWRSLIMCLCAFYMANSIIQVMRDSLVAKNSFWLATLCLYGSMFYIVLINVAAQLHKIRQQLKSLVWFDSPNYLVHPQEAKEIMYRMFLGVVLLFMVAQFLSQGLTMWDARWWTVLLCYEAADFVVFSIIAWTFRPQEHSPYFFMVEAQVRQQEQTTRLLPIIEACEAADEDTYPGDEDGARVIELTPFLSRNRSKRQLSQRRIDRVVVVRNPNKMLELGVSDTGPQLAATETPPAAQQHPLELELPPPPPPLPDARL